MIAAWIGSQSALCSKLAMPFTMNRREWVKLQRPIQIQFRNIEAAVIHAPSSKFGCEVASSSLASRSGHVTSSPTSDRAPASLATPNLG